jgi:hypothetical protein
MDDRELEEKVVQGDNQLKELFIQYVGEKLKPDNSEVNVEMCVQVLAEEFPDFILLVAQENFLRGYRQCLLDMERTENEQKSQQIL